MYISMYLYMYILRIITCSSSSTCLYSIIHLYIICWYGVTPRIENVNSSRELVHSWYVAVLGRPHGHVESREFNILVDAFWVTEPLVTY